MRIFEVIVVFVFASLLTSLVGAQQAPLFAQSQQQQAPKASQQANPAPSVPGPTMPSDNRIAMMIFSTLIALNQANATGNYSVLRDMGAPGFQSANSVARIAEAFADLRGRNLDLSPILLFQPKLLRRPQLNAEGMLRVTGFFATQPERVNFDLIFEFVADQWRLFGMAVDTIQAPPPAAAAVGKPTPVQAGDHAPAASPGPAPKAAATPDVRDR